MARDYTPDEYKHVNVSQVNVSHMNVSQVNVSQAYRDADNVDINSSLNDTQI